MELDQRSHGRRRGTTHLSDRAPYQGGDEGIPSGGMPRKGRDADADECGDCGKGMAAGSLEAHPMKQHGKAKEDKWSWTDTDTGGGGEPHTYRIELPTKGGRGNSQWRDAREGTGHGRR